MSQSQEGYSNDPTSSNTESYEKPKVYVCTSAQPFNVQGLIDELLHKCRDLVEDVQYFELPYNDIDRFKFKGTPIDTMILCHSINNRRFAITDVLDALYDMFLPNAAKALGKHQVCVIVHDFPPEKQLDKPDKYTFEMEVFRSKQPTTFKNASAVMMAGKLEGTPPVQLQESNWDELKAFLEGAASKAPRESSGSRWTWWQNLDSNKRCAVWVFLGLVVIGIIIAVIAILVVYLQPVLTTTMTPMTSPGTSAPPVTTDSENTPGPSTLNSTADATTEAMTT